MSGSNASAQSAVSDEGRGGGAPSPADTNKARKLIGLCQKDQSVVQSGHWCAPIVWKARKRLTDNFVAAIFLDFDYCHRKKAENAIWNVAFYSAIKSTREQMQGFLRGGDAGKAEAEKLSQQVSQFLTGAIAFYESLIAQFVSMFQLESLTRPHLDDESLWPSLRQKYEYCHRFLIRVGDLYRYHSHLTSAFSGKWQKCTTYFQRALALWPSNGHPYNLLAQNNDEMTSLYFYIRALSTSLPFKVAQKNVSDLLERTYRKKYPSDPSQSGRLDQLSELSYKELYCLLFDYLCVGTRSLDTVNVHKEFVSQLEKLIRTQNSLSETRAYRIVVLCIFLVSRTPPDRTTPNTSSISPLTLLLSVLSTLSECTVGYWNERRSSLSTLGENPLILPFSKALYVGLSWLSHHPKLLAPPSHFKGEGEGEADANESESTELLWWRKFRVMTKELGNLAIETAGFETSFDSDAPRSPLEEETDLKTCSFLHDELFTIGNPPVPGLSLASLSSNLLPLSVTRMARVRRAMFATVALSLVYFEIYPQQTFLFFDTTFNRFTAPPASPPASFAPSSSSIDAAAVPARGGNAMEIALNEAEDEFEEEILFKPTGVALSPSLPPSGSVSRTNAGVPPSAFAPPPATISAPATTSSSFSAAPAASAPVISPPSTSAFASHSLFAQPPSTSTTTTRFQSPVSLWGPVASSSSTSAPSPTASIWGPAPGGNSGSFVPPPSIWGSEVLNGT
eukprot:TRINITY_DN7619_c0_g1_i1.p1 TRINITY_DN7619_c0_g1~~TRINITY_DN7619_c0_g1_i1.p1  ORF type:complete len:734 (+),score=158.91 TRINITY_DN7619_c0_g1_i1:22-2223(+)